MPWLPDPVARLVSGALIGELTVVAGDGRPVTYPMVPIVDGERIVMTSSALDSRKLRHIKSNPKVCLSVTDPAACPGEPGRATIAGDARVIDDDLHTDWVRLLPAIGQKDPSIPGLFKARLAFPLITERAIIELTPKRSMYWPDGRTDTAPVVSAAGAVEEAAR